MVQPSSELRLDLSWDHRTNSTRKLLQNRCFPRSSDYELDYKLQREDVPCRVSEYQRIPPLISRLPVKIRRTHMGMGVKNSFSPHKGPRNSHLPPRQIKLGTEDLQAIRGELSQIKAQVDSLLDSLERMDQQRDQPAGMKDQDENRGAGSAGFSGGTTEAPQTARGRGPADSSEASTAMEAAVKNHVSDQEGSQ